MLEERINDVPDEGEALGPLSVEQGICMASVAEFLQRRPKPQPEDPSQTTPLSGSLAI